MKIEELIEKLPEEFHELAKRYLPMLIDMGFEELQNWVLTIAAGQWQPAYQMLIRRMTLQEQLYEVRRLNEMLRDYNDKNAGLAQVQKDIVRELLLTALQMLRALVV